MTNNNLLRPTGLVGRVILKYYGDFLLFNTNYAFDGWIVRVPAFFPFFLFKKIKKQAHVPESTLLNWISNNFQQIIPKNY